MAFIEPRSRSLEQLIADVRGGRLRVPRFQRQFVWRADQVLKLLDSVRLRYPIGALLVWRTPERHASFERLGAIPLPRHTPPEGAEVGYVLDGHQRLSALVGTLGLSEAEASDLHGADRVFLVYYDLAEREFIHAQHPKPEHLPVRYLLPVGSNSTRDPLVEWLDKHREDLKRGTPERAIWDQYAREANGLRTTFAQYVVRYDDVTDASIEDALDIFVRLNNQASPARREDVFAALSFSPGSFDFSRRAREIVESNPGFETLSRSVVLHALTRSLGMSVYDQDWATILKKYSDQLPTKMDLIGEALERTCGFLRSAEIGARHARVVPYGLQVVLLTRFFELNPSPTDAQRARLRDWFWASSYGAVYGGTGALALDAHLDRAERLARGEDLPIFDVKPTLQPLPRRFHPRAARVRAWHLFLATLHPRDLDSTKPIQDPLKNGIQDVRPLFKDDLAMQLGARILIGRGGGDPWRRLQGVQGDLWRQQVFSQVLSSHAIPEEAHVAALRGDPQRFVDLRFEHMAELERQHARAFTTLPEVSDFYDEPVIDVEEEEGEPL